MAGVSIQIKRTKRWVPPKLKLDRECLETLGKVGVASVLYNIANQQQADGSALKSNSPEWTKTKRKMGLRDFDKSLVAMGRRLIRGKNVSYKATIVERGNGSVVIKPSDELMTVSRMNPKRTRTGRLERTKTGRVKKEKVTSTASPMQLTRWVQEHGYRGWFGINDAARAAVRVAIRAFLKRAIVRASGG